MNRTEVMKTFDERFEHLYSEKWIHISRRNRQTLITGYRPDSKGHFHFCIRLLDHRNDKVLTLTLFQFVRLMKDLRDVLFSEEEVEILDEVDARIQFKFKEINVATVLIEVDAGQAVPNLFQLNLRNHKSDPASTIVCDRKTLKKIIEFEEEIINTIETLEDKSCNYMFNLFVTTCADHLKMCKTDRDGDKFYNEIKEMNKTPFQSEMFLKYWPLICTLIDHKYNETIV